MQEHYHKVVPRNTDGIIKKEKSKFADKINKEILRVWNHPDQIGDSIENFTKESERLVHKLSCMGAGSLPGKYSYENLMVQPNQKTWHRQWINLALHEASQGNPKYFSSAVEILTSDTFFEYADIGNTAQKTVELFEKWLPYISRLSELGDRKAQYVMSDIYEDNRLYIFPRGYSCGFSDEQRLSGLHKLASQGYEYASSILEFALEYGLKGRNRLEQLSPDLKERYAISPKNSKKEESQRTHMRDRFSHEHVDSMLKKVPWNSEVYSEENLKLARETFDWAFENRGKLASSFSKFLVNSIVYNRYRLYEPMCADRTPSIGLSSQARWDKLILLAKEGYPEAQRALYAQFCGSSYDRDFPNIPEAPGEMERKKLLGELLISISNTNLTNDIIHRACNQKQANALKKLVRLRSVFR